MTYAPAERFGYHAPSEAQLRFATKLGITVPAGISRYGLSQLIDRAKLSTRRSAIASTLEQLAPGARLRNIQTGVTYRVCSIDSIRGEAGAYNEVARHGCSLGLQSLFRYYELVSDSSGNLEAGQKS